MKTTKHLLTIIPLKPVAPNTSRSTQRMEPLDFCLASFWRPLHFGGPIRLVLLDVFGATEKAREKNMYSLTTVALILEKKKGRKWKQRRFNPLGVSACSCVLRAQKESAPQCFGHHFGTIGRLLVPFWRALDFEGVPKSIIFRTNSKQMKKTTSKNGVCLIDFWCQNGRPEIVKNIISQYTCCNSRDLGGQEH